MPPGAAAPLIARIGLDIPVFGGDLLLAQRSRRCLKLPHQAADNRHKIIAAHHPLHQVEGLDPDGDVFAVDALEDHVLLLGDEGRMSNDDSVEGQERNVFD
jgi:hypothetical protein